MKMMGLTGLPPSTTTWKKSAQDAVNAANKKKPTTHSRMGAADAAEPTSRGNKTPSYRYENQRTRVAGDDNSG